MTFKFIQINIFKGKYFDSLVDFLRQENPDLISMQEVTAGAANLYGDKGTNIFELLKEKLKIAGVFHADIEFSDYPNAAFGNAVFSKRPIIKSEVVVLKTFRPVTLFEFNNNSGNIWADLPRHMLDATINFGDFKIHAISVHGRRIAPPADDAENIRQAKVVASYLRSLGGESFIVGGDFNMPLGSEVIKIVSGVSINLMEGADVTQTLNPRVHERGEKGYLVDFVFCSAHFEVESLNVPEVDISDHLPVIVKLTLSR